MGSEEPTTLAWVESCLPAPDPQARLELARRHGLALELANDGRTRLEAYRDCGVPVAALQAWRLHDVHPLHPERAARAEALQHVEKTVEEADRLGARRVVTVCGYGQELADAPFERCLDFFDAAAGRAGELGVRLLVEPLSPLRVAAMTEPSEIVRLLETLDRPDVLGLLLDTGHLLDSGHEVDDLGELFAGLAHPIEELQVRGAADRPPDEGWPYEEWLSRMEARPAVVSGEYREPIEPDTFERLVERLREAL